MLRTRTTQARQGRVDKGCDGVLTKHSARRPIASCGIRGAARRAATLAMARDQYGSWVGSVVVGAPKKWFRWPNHIGYADVPVGHD